MDSGVGRPTVAEAGVAQSVPADGQSVLILASPLADGTSVLCGDLLGGENPVATNYLAVTLTGTPDERLDHWRRHVTPELPAKATIICCGETTRGLATADSCPTQIAGSAIRLATVSTPADLTGLGIEINKCLSAWADDDSHPIACVDSLTTLLQYTDPEQVFRFLHLLLAQLESAGGTVHAHCDPAAHDSRALATIRSLFDTVMEPHAEETL